jgi:GNAT superfamily N-acetyltransferase
MNLRPGTTNDAAAVADLIASFRHELTDHPDGAGAERFFESVSAQAERSYLESARYRYIVAERDGAMLGFITLRDVSHVFHLFVARQHHRTGVADRLWQEARAHAVESGMQGPFTVNASLRAVPVYRSFGFVEAGEVASAHGISFLPMRLSAASAEPH